jgi:hypothetical protein
VDIDAGAVGSARQRLGAILGGRANIRHADALAIETFDNACCDCLVGNPPYASIRQLARALPRERIDDWKARFHTASGNFDLYVLFIERAIELLRPGGRCVLVIPNKWQALDYARECRELLLTQTTIEHVVDLSAGRVFARASVYPQILVFRKQPPPSLHAVCTSAYTDPQRERGAVANDGILQSSLSPAAISLERDFDVESRVPTVPLGQLCQLSCGTAGYAARRIAERLIEADDSRNATEGVPPSAAALDFITSGNIDRYQIEPGNVRYLGRTYRRPRLARGIPELTEAKRRLFAEPKIVVAGMSRRLEAAWDGRGLALGVQVFAARDFNGDPFYLLALLNSKLLSFLFRTRFAAKRLAGGYLAINKGQLAQLPMAARADLREQVCSRLSRLAQAMHRQPQGRLDREIDRLVYEQYQLTDAEIDRVEQAFLLPRSRAA